MGETHEVSVVIFRWRPRSRFELNKNRGMTWRPKFRSEAQQWKNGFVRTEHWVQSTQINVQVVCT